MGNQASGETSGGGASQQHLSRGGGGSNNNNSNSNNNLPHHIALRNMLRPTTGSLGLSKAELDKQCKPSGLYPSVPWEEKAIRRLIADGKLAARLVGSEGPLNVSMGSNVSNKQGQSQQQQQAANSSTIECPICFLHYSAVNVTKCCQAFICTECYLQIRPQKAKSITCPFCNSNHLKVKVLHNIQEEVAERERQEQLTIEAEIQRRHNEQQQQQQEQAVSQNDEMKPNRNSFGNALERTLSDASASTNTESQSTANADSIMVKSVQERQRLEEQMRAQHSHPLSQRLQQEEQERRIRNEREYYEQRMGQLRDIRSRREQLLQQVGSESGSRSHRSGGGGGSSHRDWNRIVDAFENSGGRSVQSLDDLVVLEAAIMLSMEEEARRREAGNGNGGGNEDNGGDADGASEAVRFDAAEHASAGFPLARSRVSSRRAASGASTISDNLDLNTHMMSLMRSLHNQQQQPASRGGRGNRGSGSRAGYRDARLDAVAMHMRGISEEEQIAMAIAASLEEQQIQEEEHQRNRQEQGQGREREGRGTDSEAGAVDAEGGNAAAADNTEEASGGDVSLDSSSSNGSYSSDSEANQSPSPAPTAAELGRSVAAAPTKEERPAAVTPQQQGQETGKASAEGRGVDCGSKLPGLSSGKLKDPPPPAPRTNSNDNTDDQSSSTAPSMKVSGTASTADEGEEEAA